MTYGGTTDVTKFITNSDSGSDYRLNVAPAFEIVNLRPNSPAQLIGLQMGDIILEVNGVDVKKYSLQEVVQLFKGKDGKKMTIKVERSGKPFLYKFQLKNLLN